MQKVRIVELHPLDAFYKYPGYVGSSGIFVADNKPYPYPPGDDFQPGLFKAVEGFNVYFYAVKVENI
jgi:hypothetical protein